MKSLNTLILLLIFLPLHELRANNQHVAHFIELMRQQYEISIQKYITMNKNKQQQTLKDLRVLRNAIYAFHGYTFKSRDLNRFFKQFKWYKPLHKEVKHLLSQRDKSNLNIIISAEQKLKWKISVQTTGRTLNQNEQELVGFWQDAPVMSSGLGDAYSFFANGSVIFHYAESDCAKRTFARYGTWRLAGKNLYISFDREGTLSGGRLIKATGSCSSANELTGAIIQIVPIKNPQTQKYTVSKIIYNKDFMKDEMEIERQKLWRFSKDPFDYL